MIILRDCLIEKKNTRLYAMPKENAIMHAARIGVSLKNSTAYVTWPPCSRCARSLIQAGVTEVVYSDAGEIPERWKEDFKTSTDMMKEAGLKVRSIK